jgi:hypothetical protein
MVNSHAKQKNNAPASSNKIFTLSIIMVRNQLVKSKILTLDAMSQLTYVLSSATYPL